jgi:hypothetical protein
MQLSKNFVSLFIHREEEISALVNPGPCDGFVSGITVWVFSIMKKSFSVQSIFIAFSSYDRICTVMPTKVANNHIVY